MKRSIWIKVIFMLMLALSVSLGSKVQAENTKSPEVKLTATVSPTSNTDKTVKWSTSNKKIATVSSKGKAKPYVKYLSAGTWKAGKHLKAGRYRITTNFGSGNLFITGKDFNIERSINEILTSEDDEFGVKVVTADIKSGDKIEIMGLDSVKFKRVKHVLSKTLTTGNHTVGKDIKPGTYKMTTPSGSGNLFIYRRGYPIVNEILSKDADYYTVRSVTKTLKSGDRINISALERVVFTKK